MVKTEPQLGTMVKTEPQLGAMVKTEPEAIICMNGAGPSNPGGSSQPVGVAGGVVEAVKQDPSKTVSWLASQEG